MSILRVRHITSYAYRNPVSLGEHRLMFRPRDAHDQRLISAELEITPEPAAMRWVYDVFGNLITIVDFEGETTTLRVETSLVLEHTPSLPFEIEDSAMQWPFDYDASIAPDVAPFLRPHHPASEIDDWARQFTGGGRIATGHLLFTMTNAISDGFAYSRRLSPGTQLPLETLALHKGTCRDFALLMMEACRSLGLAARFVTGYLYVPSRDVAERRGGGATHAWVQVFLPGAGWVEFDPTNGIVGSRDLIRVGVAREPSQAKPLSGSFSGPREDYLGMDVEVQVTRDV